jgi:putative ABC transport system substrate-binding protein
MPVIGVLRAQSADDDYKNVTVPFLQGLKETGYVEGQNVAVEYRYAENQIDRLPALAANLVRRRGAVIIAAGTAEALAARPCIADRILVPASSDCASQYPRRRCPAVESIVVSHKASFGSAGNSFH